MDVGLFQLLFWIFLFGVVVMAYEIAESFRPPVCKECSHCRAIKEEERRRQAQARDAFARRYGIHEDEDRGRR